ncbi:MAG: DNA-binding protein [Eggerthellaceae bacterium]|nr:DNA-binding protein [Eggerthellaceae bacterium]
MEEEDGYFVYLFDFDRATQGDDMPDALHMASDLLRFMVEDCLVRGEELPAPLFTHEPQRGGRIVAVTADVDLRASEDFVTASDAARLLGVSAPRVSRMLKDGLLHGYKERGNTFVTIESINALKSTPRSAGRPRKEPVTV